MNIVMLRRFVLVLLALLVLAAPAVHAQGAPAGDNVGAPVDVVVNGQETVTGIEFATLQSPASIEETDCDGDATSDHSVWFRFTLPVGAVVDVDSGGTMMDAGSLSHSFVVLTLYRETSPGVRLEDSCVLSSTARLTQLNLAAGAYFVRVANDAASPPTGPSQYRVSVRLRFMPGMLQDPDFDTALGTDWKAKNAGDPAKVTRVCSPNCHVRFGGIANGKVSQTVVFDPAVLKFKKGDILFGNIFVSNTPAAGSDVKLTLKITYSNGRPASKFSLTRHMTNTSTVVFTTFGTVYAEIESKAVKSIKFFVTSPQADDLFSIDQASLSVQAGTSVRDVPLPLPPAP